MKKYKLICLMGMVFLLIHCMVGAQDTVPVRVCGQDIENIGWTTFSEGSGETYIDNGDAKGLYEELRKQLNDESSDWPEDLSVTYFKAMDGLIAGTFKLADFNITKDVSGIQAKQYAFIHTPLQFELPPSTSSKGCDSDIRKSALLEAATFTMLVQRSGVEIYKPYFRKNAETIKTLESTYDKYLYEGFPMYPWEALVSSWLLTDKSIADGPPTNQIVFMHPAAGVISSVGSGSDTDIDVALSVEPLGWIRYTDNYSSWYGASLLAVFPTDRDAGFGFTLNYNNFKLGVTWHDYDNNYEDPTIFFGVDLYQFVSKKYRKYTSYKEKVTTILKSKH